MLKSRAARVVSTAVAVGFVAVVLAGCVPGDPMPVPTYTPSGSPSPSASARPVPMLRPGGTAAQNQQWFDYVNEAHFGIHGMGDSKSIVDDLVTEGFIKADMQITPDRTALDILVDAIQVSVKIGNECLIGQFSPAGYEGILAPALSNGSCLIGTTLPIDW